MAVGPDIAIPIGLIVTEAVSSALDRSFDGVTMPEIRIEAGDKAGMVELVIEDNGAGPGGRIRPDVRSGFGLNADPRAGDAAGRRGRSIVARRRRHEGQRDLPQARGAGGRCVTCVSPRARPASSSD